MNEQKSEEENQKAIDERIEDSLYSSPGDNFFRMSFGISAGIIGLAVGFGISFWITQNPLVAILRGGLICFLLMVAGGLLGAFWDNAARKVEKSDKKMVAELLISEMKKAEEEREKEEPSEPEETNL